MSLDTLREQLDSLRQHTDPLPDERPSPDNEAQLAGKQLESDSIPVSTTPSRTLPAALKQEIQTNRVTATAMSRAVEAEIATILARSPIPAAVISILIGNVCRFFKAIAELRPTWLPAEIQIPSLHHLHTHGNHRQQFHSLREFVPHLRRLLERLANSHCAGDTLLLRLGRLGVLVPYRVLATVAERHEGRTEEILNGPTAFRRIWKPVARERVAPEDGGKQGPYTAHLWQTALRAKEVTNPPFSEAEVQELFGPEATLASHANEKAPWACGAHKWEIVPGNPVAAECTAMGLHLTSGPSGTGYRFLNLWLVLNGAEEDLPAVRLAVASMLLSGGHHSLMEVMMVAAPLVGCEQPTGMLDMIEELVPGEVAITAGGERFSITAEEFRGELEGRINGLLGRNR